MAGNRRIRNAALATLAVLTLATACGRVAPGSASSVQQIVRDPENPAWIGAAGTAGSSTTTFVVRDPENPHYTGAAAASGSTVRDPENPYWNGR